MYCNENYITWYYIGIQTHLHWSDWSHFTPCAKTTTPYIFTGFYTADFCWYKVLYTATEILFVRFNKKTYQISTQFTVRIQFYAKTETVHLSVCK